MTQTHPDIAACIARLMDRGWWPPACLAGEAHTSHLVRPEGAPAWWDGAIGGAPMPPDDLTGDDLELWHSLGHLVVIDAEEPHLLCEQAQQAAS